MAKTKQVLHLVDNGKEYMVVRHFGKTNPYRIYHLYRTWGEDNRPHDHKVCVEQSFSAPVGKWKKFLLTV